MFQTALALRADPRPDLWVITEPLVWVDKRYGRLEVPVGFVTDLASTPFHVDDNGPSRRPAAMHDALYALYRRYGKDFADAFLRDSILAEKGGHIRSQLYYRAVSWFGGSSWRADGQKAVGSGSFATIAAFESWRARKVPGASLTEPGTPLA